MRVHIEEPEADSPRVPFLKKYPRTILLLALLAVIVYGWAALTPSLFGDEWGFLYNNIRFGGPECPNWDRVVRPFGGCWTAFVYRVVGANMGGFHAFGVLASFISALLLLATLDVLWPDWAANNGAVAALYLLFPADMTRTWLAGIVVVGTAIFLLAAYFMARFWRDGRWWAWFVGMVVVIIALNTYEIPLGAIVAMSGLAFLFARHRTWLQRIAMLGPVMVSAGFALWRWSWQQSQGEVFGHETGDIMLSPPILIDRLWVGAKYVLRDAWTDTVLGLLPFTTNNGRVALAIGLGVLVGLVALTVLAALWISRRVRRFDPAVARDGVGMGQTLDLLIAGGVGLVIMAAGYFPIIMAINPGTEFTASRSHHLPSVGAAMFIGAILFGVGRWLGKSGERARFIALAGTLPLLMLGIAGHVMVARQTQQAWAEQKLIWNSLFEQAPNIAKGTHVLILQNGYGIPGKAPRPFISGSWALTRGMYLFYGNGRLSASFTSASPQRVLSIDGDDLVLTNRGTTRFPAGETLVFVFNRADQELVQIKELEKDGEVLSLGADRIIDTPAAESEWRWLVAD